METGLLKLNEGDSYTLYKRKSAEQCTINDVKLLVYDVTRPVFIDTDGNKIPIDFTDMERLIYVGAYRKCAEGYAFLHYIILMNDNSYYEIYSSIGDVTYGRIECSEGEELIVKDADQEDYPEHAAMILEKNDTVISCCVVDREEAKELIKILTVFVGEE